MRWGGEHDTHESRLDGHLGRRVALVELEVEVELHGGDRHAPLEGGRDDVGHVAVGLPEGVFPIVAEDLDPTALLGAGDGPHGQVPCEPGLDGARARRSGPQAPPRRIIGAPISGRPHV